EVDRHVLTARRDAQAHADLTVSDLAERAAVLALHADGVFALLRKAGVVDDPSRHGLAALQRRNRMAGGDEPHRFVVPIAPGEKVQKTIGRAVRCRRLRLAARRDRLAALALAIAENSERVGRKRSPLAVLLKELSDLREVRLEPRLGRLRHASRHAADLALCA